MDALLTRSEGRLRRDWVSMLAHLRDENGIDAITARLATGGHHDVLPDLEATAGKFAASEHAVYVTAAQAAARWLNGQFQKVEKKFSVFDVSDPPALKWAQQNQLKLIREISDEQREVIRGVLEDGARTGVGPRAMAKEIRESIGLTSYQRDVVQNYRRALEAGDLSGALARELRHGGYDASLRTAIRDRQPIPADRIDKMVDAYQRNFIALRAETIARTEGLRVAHQGSEELYRQAVASGDLHPDQIVRTWNHSPGAKNKNNERSFHKSMHGQVRAFGELFTSGIGGRLRFPGDPDAGPGETLNCRCAVSTRVVVAAGRAARPSIPTVPPIHMPPPVPIAPPAPRVQLETMPPSSEAIAGRQQQQLQQAQQRLAEHRVALDLARADAERIAAAHAAVEAEVAQLEEGFRIGVASEIAGGANDIVPALAGPRVAVRPPPVLAPPRRMAPPTALTGDPYRTPGSTGIEIVPTDRPAPVGYEAADYQGQTLYRHRVSGQTYTAAQVQMRQGDSYHFEVTGPEAGTVPGFVTLEVREPHMPHSELRYRSVVSGTVYTADQIASGEAIELERWLVAFEAKENQRPGFLARLGALLTGGPRG